MRAAARATFAAVIVLPATMLVVAALAAAAGLREPWLALLALPGLYVAPGLAWARGWAARRGPVDAVALAFDSFWFGLPAGIAGHALAVGVGGGVATQLAVATASAVVGELWVRRGVASGRMRPELVRPPPRPALAVVAGAVLLGAWFARSAGDVARPLDRYWYVAGVEDRLPVRSAAPAVLGAHAVVGEADEGVVRGEPGAPLTLTGPHPDPFLILVHGPVGQGTTGLGAPVVVRSDPVEDAAEGPVARYQDAGVAARWVDGLAEGEALHLQPDADVQLYVVAAQDGVWSLHGSGELRWVHYYQLLNMVEQLRWADARWVTDVQPPLWTRVLAPALALTGGGQPTVNVLLALVLALGVLGGVGFLQRHAPDAPTAAWLLPGAAAVVVGKLVLEPGSAGMPDALYGVAIVAGLAGRYEGFGLAAQLLRYPGAAVVALGALLAGDRRAALRLGALVAAVAALFGLGGAVTGELDGWLGTVAWESGPEHWHGEHDPAVLLGRAPEFYRTWFTYAAGTPLLAALAWPRGTRVALGTAALYSLLLCTIDHSPTHYFVPLVTLSALALGCTAGQLGGRRGDLVAAAGTLGLAWFWLRGELVG